MRNFKYILLVLGLIELVIGFSNVQENILFYLGLPVGTILLGLCMIIQVWEKETELHTAQIRADGHTHGH